MLNPSLYVVLQEDDGCYIDDRGGGRRGWLRDVMVLRS